VLFSGSLDPMVNKVDYRKLANKYYSNRSSQSSLSPQNLKLVKATSTTLYEQEVLQQLSWCKSKLESKELLRFIWEMQETEGSQPSSREGTGLAFISAET